MPTIPYRTVEFIELPTRTPVLAKVLEAEFTNEKNPFFGKKDAKGKVDERETRDVIKVKMVATDNEYAGAYIWKTFGASIHEKSSLRPFIQCCSERELTLDELKAFNTDTLVGKYVLVVGEYSDNDPEHKFLAPTSFVRPSKAQIKEAEANAAERKAANKREPVTSGIGTSKEIDF